MMAYRSHSVGLATFMLSRKGPKGTIRDLFKKRWCPQRGVKTT